MGCHFRLLAFSAKRKEDLPSVVVSLIAVVVGLIVVVVGLIVVVVVGLIVVVVGLIVVVVVVGQWQGLHRTGT